MSYKVGSMKYIAITGVSTGIGYATAARLIAYGYHVFGSVRRPADADRLKDEWGENFTPLLFDVTDDNAIKMAVSQVESRIGEVGLSALINNAGIFKLGPLASISLPDFRTLFEVNLFGVLNVTQAFLPLLGAQKNVHYPPGRIINISSTGGRIAYPFMGAYTASKHALEALSDTLRRELVIYGIDVIVIEPGLVDTPIINKAEEQTAHFLTNTDYEIFSETLQAQIAKDKRIALPVALISRTIHKALETPRPKSRYPVISRRFVGWLLPRLLPARWVDRLIARQLGFKKITTI